MTDLPGSLGNSRRHLLKAFGIVAGAAGTYVPAKASADCLFGIICFGDNSGSGSGSGSGSDSGSGTGGAGNTCFLRGTRIRTTGGLRRIETLATGDTLPARFGGTMTVRRVSSFAVTRDPSGAWPHHGRMVRVRRGALDDNVPSADLCLTASHALFLDDVLVRVGSLVNGVTIHDDTAPDRDALEFFHVELDRHDVIEAEGALAESLQAPTMEACVPVLEFNGGRSEVGSRLRSALAPLVDRRRPLDRLRDRLEERAAL